MTTMKTPGVYIQEKDAFGNSVVPVPTAVPAFIGYTLKTNHSGQNLVNTPVKITSLADFLNIFGGTPPKTKYTLTQLGGSEEASGDDSQSEEPASDDATTEEPAQVPSFSTGTKNYLVECNKAKYRLYTAMKFFYANGGGSCYVISAGGYDGDAMQPKPFLDAIKALEKEPEPTMIVIPDAVEFKDDSKTVNDKKYQGCYDLQAAAMNHCGKFMNRVAILDVPGGYEEVFGQDPIEAFRGGASPSMPKYNSYGAAYYPWLHTTILTLNHVTSENIDEGSFAAVKQLIDDEFNITATLAEPDSDDPEMLEQQKIAKDKANKINGYIDDLLVPESEDGTVNLKREEAEGVLGNLSETYKLFKAQILKDLNLLAPSAAMAGLYTAVDNSRGVWIAPANVAVQNVITPAVKIDHAMQEDLNVPLNGKSICAIRAFTGLGSLVWGARTLDGNSNDWRYINVRRTLIFLEQSVKEAAKAFVFAPNDGNTWVSVKSMISNFLIGIWKQGGLVGPSPDTAFEVSVGLGSTMSNDDILNGIMRITVKVAVSRPAEFIEITFQQQQQQA